MNKSTNLIEIGLIISSFTVSWLLGIAVLIYVWAIRTQIIKETDELRKNILDGNTKVNIDLDTLKMNVQSAINEFKSEVDERNQQVTDELQKISDIYKENDKTLKEVLEHSKLVEQIEDSLDEDLNTGRTPEKLTPYQDYIIEDYGGMYIVFDPTTKKRWAKSYHDINKAMTAIERSYL